MANPRYGLVSLVGRPNAGKSTLLLNRILGQKVSIVSAKPQTTRNRIVGILNEKRGQIAFLDTPGDSSAAEGSGVAAGRGGGGRMNAGRMNAGRMNAERRTKNEEFRNASFLRSAFCVLRSEFSF